MERHSEQAEVPSLFLSREHVLTSSTYHLLLHLESCGVCFPNTNSDLSEDVGSNSLVSLKMKNLTVRSSQ